MRGREVLKHGKLQQFLTGPFSCFPTPKQRVERGAAAFPDKSLLVAIETSSTATVTKIHLFAGASFLCGS